ncbi:MAG: DMT family transporter [Hyphomicrobiaceae bacterium]|nr:DMT family transporter [Hyphomicrobiaceae bacterium]
MNKARPGSPTTPAGEDARHENHILAIALMCCAVTVFSTVDAAAKYLADDMSVPVLQVIWVRFLFHALLTVLIFGFVFRREVVRSNKPTHQFVRSLLVAVTTGFNFVAIKYLQLDQTVTIFFLTPLLVAALAGPILGEWVGWRRLLAIFTGFIGVLLVTRPGFGGIHWAVLYSFAATITYAFYSIHTRYMAAHDTPEVNLFYTAFAGALLGAPLGLAVWEWPGDALTWGLFLWLGLTGMVGHWLLILSFKYAPAPVVAPFIYVSLLSMIGLGYVVFGDVPTLWTLAGGAVVIGSGLYLLYRERRLSS